jgi:S-(hydroxymethyl)glutathione dehydrogenase/alcohol dehydrogenase
MKAAVAYEPNEPLVLPDVKKTSALCGCGSFAEAMVVDEATIVPVQTDLPDDQLALLGCGVTTGLGAALNTAAVNPGSSVAVIGCDGVGQLVIQGARIAGASTPSPSTGSLAGVKRSCGWGATHAVDFADGDPVEQVRAPTDGRGADDTFEAVGLPQLLLQASYMARPEGTVTYIGMPAGRDAALTVPAVSAIFTGKRIQGSGAGGPQVPREFPRFVRLAETGQSDLGGMVSRRSRSTRSMGASSCLSERRVSAP